MAEMFPNHPNLVGGYEPLLMECDVHDMRVEGEVPSALNGSFYPVSYTHLTLPTNREV